MKLPLILAFALLATPAVPTTISAQPAPAQPAQPQPPQLWFGDAPTVAPPLATNLSPALKPPAIARPLRLVGDWELRQAQPHFSQDWTFAALYAGYMAVPDAAGGPQYRAAMLQMARQFQFQPGPRLTHADDQAIGQTYLDLYAFSHDPQALAPIQTRMDQLMRQPEDPQSPLWWWCDALFMAPPALVKLSAATHNPAYLDYMDRHWWQTSALLYDPAEHLYFRDKSFLQRRQANGKPLFWSRGNGWVMAGLARVLAQMPPTYPTRPRYVAQLREMAAAVLAIQGPDGLWRPGLLDPQAYPLPEASGSAFITYALAWGIQNGVLDRATYLPAVTRAWAGLLAHVYQDGRLGCVQPIGAAPGNYPPTASYVFGTGAFLLAGSEIYQLASSPAARAPQLVLTNPLRTDRPTRVLELPLPQLLAQLHLTAADAPSLVAEDAATGQPIPSQLFPNAPATTPDQLLLYLSLPAHGSRTIAFRLDPGAAPTQPLVFGREAPERKDDFAWENQFVAYRIYGPALEATGEITSGIDVWSKRVPNFVIDTFYKRDAEGARTHNPQLTYHKDNGQGLDSYYVGPTRGCGGTAVFHDGKLFVSKNYTQIRQLSSGPLRFAFEVTYAPWSVSPISPIAPGLPFVTETKRITLDAGTHMNQIASTYTFPGNAPLQLAAGIAIHSGADATFPQPNAIASVWDTPQDPSAGFIPTGLVAYPGQHATTLTADGHALLLFTRRSGQPFRYLAGSGWSQADMPTQSDWTAYLQLERTLLDHPVQLRWAAH